MSRNDVRSKVCFHEYARAGCLTFHHSMEFLWVDENVECAKPLRISASEYITRLLSWLEGEIRNERVFVRDYGTPFPETFFESCRRLLRRLVRVLGHILHSHIATLQQRGLTPHVELTLKHVVVLVSRFQLLTATDLMPIKLFIARLDSCVSMLHTFEE